MPDIVIILTLVGLAAAASIVLTSSYKRLWKTVVKNGGTVSLAEATQTCAAPAEAPQTKQEAFSEPTATPEAVAQDIPHAPIQNPVELPTTPAETSTPPSLVEEVGKEAEAHTPAAIEPKKEEAAQPTSRPTRRRRTASSQATRRYKKAKGAKKSTDKQPLS